MKGLRVIAYLAIVAMLDDGRAETVFGLEGGVNLANMNQSPWQTVSTKIKPGVMIGGVLENSMYHRITINFECLFVQKGWKEKAEILGLDYEGIVSVNELVLAASLGLKDARDDLSPFVRVGPELGINLSKNVEWQLNGESGTEALKNWSNTNFGLNMGGGLGIPARSGEIVLEARYNLGLANMYSGGGNQTMKTNGVQLIARYNFRRLAR